jgi:hypothetical protein
VDLFTLILQSAVGWGVGRVLDTMASCFACGQRDGREIGNEQANWLECSNCHRTLEQFTNACDLTVNRSTGQIGHAVFGVGSHRWQWRTGSGMFDFNAEWLSVPFRVRIEGLRGRDLVFETELLNYDDSESIVSHKSILRPSCDVTTWSDLTHSFHQSKLPDERGLIVACDARILSEHRDLLFEDRRLLTPWGEP